MIGGELAAFPPRRKLCRAAEPPRLPLRRELDFCAAKRRKKTEGEITRGCSVRYGVGVH